MVKIFADSTLDLPQEIIEEYDIGVIPVRVLSGDKEIQSTPNLFERLKRGEKLSTSQPSPKQFFDAFMESKEKELIALTLSKNVSGAYQSALVAQRMANGKGKDVTVVDSKSASAGLGLIVMNAAIRAKEGSTKAELLQLINELTANTRLLVFAETFRYGLESGRIAPLARMLAEHEKEKTGNEPLEKEKHKGWGAFLAKGGEVSFERRALAKLADLNLEDLERKIKKIENIAILFEFLRIRVLARIKGGHVIGGGATIGSKKGIKKLIKYLEKDLSELELNEKRENFPLSIVVAHSNASDRLEELRGKLSSYNCQNLIETQVGPVLGMFTGPGAILLAYCPVIENPGKIQKVIS
jgi:fatty acid-binding protein DegV